MDKPGFLAPAGTLEKKPPHGAPCNRCGLCCVATLCVLAAHVFRGRKLPTGGHIPGPCPALGYDAEGLSRCGLVDEPMKHAMGVTLRAGVDATRAAAKLLVGSGTGCDARVNGEPKNEAFYETLRQWDRRHAAEVRTARRVWGL